MCSGQVPLGICRTVPTRRQWVAPSPETRLGCTYKMVTSEAGRWCWQLTGTVNQSTYIDFSTWRGFFYSVTSWGSQSSSMVKCPRKQSGGCTAFYSPAKSAVSLLLQFIGYERVIEANPASREGRDAPSAWQDCQMISRHGVKLPTKALLFGLYCLQKNIKETILKVST